MLWELKNQNLTTRLTSGTGIFVMLLFFNSGTKSFLKVMDTALCLFFEALIKSGMLPAIEAAPVIIRILAAVLILCVGWGLGFKTLCSPLPKSCKARTPPMMVSVVPPPKSTHAAVFDFYFFSDNLVALWKLVKLQFG